MTMQQFQWTQPGRRAGISVWRQIADILKTEIKDRRYADTGRLPGELELANRFGVNRHTLRQAVAALQTEGLLRIEPGRGTFVRHEQLDYHLSQRTRFHDNLLQQGLLPSRQLLTARVAKAPDRAAQALGQPTGSTVLMVQTLNEANGEPIGIAIAYYPAARFAGLLEMLASELPTSEILKHFGVQDYVRQHSRIGTQMPDAETARLLGQAGNRPLLWVESTDVDMAGVPIKFGESYFCGDRVQLVIEGRSAA
jgi:GntR family phosphonate transport system transcriptional regulator